LVPGDDLQVPLFLPNRDEVASLALRAELRNPNPQARLSISAKVAQAPTDWDRRTILSVPGIVWSVSSDTCATGRLSAPDNIAYDHDYREFVYRQPNNEAELAAIMSADSEEVFACYRFDGLSRWTHPAFGAWVEDLEVVVGYIRHTLGAAPEPEIAEGLQAYESYLMSSDFKAYLGAFGEYLNERRRPDTGGPGDARSSA
jgi:hypothetical protein